MKKVEIDYRIKDFYGAYFVYIDDVSIGPPIYDIDVAEKIVDWLKESYEELKEELK